MEQNKFDAFCRSFEEAMKNIFTKMPEIGLNNSDHINDSGGKRLSAIVGVVGLNKGRIHVEMNENLVKKLYEHNNGESPEDEMDLCFYLAELTNMITGNGITTLNNLYKGSNLRLTPPAIFAGENLDITTPQVLTDSRFYQTDFGTIKIEIGFEGL